MSEAMRKKRAEQNCLRAPSPPQSCFDVFFQTDCGGEGFTFGALESSNTSVKSELR